VEVRYYVDTGEVIDWRVISKVCDGSSLGGAGGFGSRNDGSIEYVSSRMPTQQCPAVPMGPSDFDVNANIQLIRSMRKGASAAWISLVWPNGAWDPKGRRYAGKYNKIYPQQLEDLGNFNYGATGRELYSATVLRAGAGLAQRMFGDPGDGPFGDNLDDAVFVNLGIMYYDRNCWR
jgi:hypothetical protein